MFHQKHKHFKLSDKGLHKFISKKSNLAIILLVFILMIVFVVVIAQNNGLQTSKDNTIQPNNNIQNSSNSNKNQIKQVNLQEYQKQLNQLVNQYLNLRLTHTQENTCSNLESLLHSLLDLRVPLEYKDLHLNLVVLMDGEIELCKQGELENIDNLSQKWYDLLKQHSWLELNQ